MKKLFQFRRITIVLLMGIATISLEAQTDRTQLAGQTPSRELVQFVREARRRGVAEDKIRQQASAVGWPEAAIDEAIAYEKSGKSLPAAPAAVQAAVPVQPKTLPPSSPALPAADAALPPSAPAEKSAPPPPQASAAAGISDDYLIGRGDTLQISVWKEPEASVPNEVVRPDGKITLPLIKEVEVAGLTPRQAEALITQKIGKFIADPNVTVVVSAINSQKIYLIGAVKKEGAIPYTYGMTVMQTLSEAGGLNDYAKRRKIYVLRTENGREYRLDFNYEEVMRGQRMEQNIVLLPGDTVVVPQ
jgi:polysaccharide biosynthesis/export protein